MFWIYLILAAAFFLSCLGLLTFCSYLMENRQ